MNIARLFSILFPRQYIPRDYLQKIDHVLMKWDYKVLRYISLGCIVLFVNSKIHQKFEIILIDTIAIYTSSFLIKSLTPTLSTCCVLVYIWYIIGYGFFKVPVYNGTWLNFLYILTSVFRRVLLNLQLMLPNLTHPHLVPYIYVSELGQHWFR